MRKQDLKVGEEYAAGSSSRYDRWKMARVRVVEVNGERLRRNGTMAQGVVVALVTDSDLYGWPRWLRGKAGDERIIESARDIQMPWATYEQAKAAFDQRQAASKAEAERAADVVDRVQVALIALGASHARSGSGFRFTADEMAALVAMIPDAVPAHSATGQVV